MSIRSNLTIEEIYHDIKRYVNHDESVYIFVNTKSEISKLIIEYFNYDIKEKILCSRNFIGDFLEFDENVVETNVLSINMEELVFTESGYFAFSKKDVLYSGFGIPEIHKELQRIYNNTLRICEA